MIVKEVAIFPPMISVQGDVVLTRSGVATEHVFQGQVVEVIYPKSCYVQVRRSPY